MAVTKYVGLLGQTGTSSPIMINILNQLGVTVGRQAEGIYTIFSNNKFINNKTSIHPFGDYDGTAAMFLPLFSESGIVGYYTMYRSDNSYIRINFKDTNGVDKDLSELAGTSLISIIIEVYS